MENAACRAGASSSSGDSAQAFIALAMIILPTGTRACLHTVFGAGFTLI
jgi:hypothetical protein